MCLYDCHVTPNMAPDMPILQGQWLFIVSLQPNQLVLNYELDK